MLIVIFQLSIIYEIKIVHKMADVINNAILKHNNNEDEPTYEYLDVWEAEIPESYLDYEQWLGDIYFSGQIDGKD
jgi:hypothetical protein